MSLFLEVNFVLEPCVLNQPFFFVTHFSSFAFVENTKKNSLSAAFLLGFNSISFQMFTSLEKAKSLQ